MPTASDARSQLRSMINDGTSPPCHYVRQEDMTRSVLGNQVGGGNLFFQLNNGRIVTGSLTVISDGVIVTPASIDYNRGTFTLTVAPVTSCLARYDFMLFVDGELDNHILEGLRFIGYTVANMANVPEGLAEPMLLNSAGHCFEALAARTAQLYDASAGGKSINKNDISKKYEAMAQEKFKLAEEKKQEFYKRQGQREAPAYGQFNTGQSEYTPRR